ncbi:MAG: AAA family ATPase [Methanosarcinales archaeon]
MAEDKWGISREDQAEAGDRVRVLSFGSPTLDKLFFGGIPTGVVFGIFGKAQVGKTMLCCQIAASCNRPPAQGGLGQPALIIDTEGMLIDPLVEQTKKFFQKRWNMPKEPVIDVRQVRTIEDLLAMFGVEAEIRFSERESKAAAKLATSSKGWEHCEIVKRFREKKYGCLILDSMTNPIKAAIALESENWSARASLMNALYGRLQKASEQFDCAMIVTHHASKAPFGYQREKPFGPSQVFYNTKWMLALLKGDKDESSRLARRERYGFLPPSKDEGEVTVKLDGQAFV